MATTRTYERLKSRIELDEYLSEAVARAAVWRATIHSSYQRQELITLIDYFTGKRVWPFVGRAVMFRNKVVRGGYKTILDASRALKLSRVSMYDKNLLTSCIRRHFLGKKSVINHPAREKAAKATFGEAHKVAQALHRQMSGNGETQVLGNSLEGYYVCCYKRPGTVLPPIDGRYGTVPVMVWDGTLRPEPFVPTPENDALTAVAVKSGFLPAREEETLEELVKRSAKEFAEILHARICQHLGKQLQRAVHPILRK